MGWQDAPVEEVKAPAWAQAPAASGSPAAANPPLPPAPTPARAPAGDPGTLTRALEAPAVPAPKPAPSQVGADALSSHPAVMAVAAQNPAKAQAIMQHADSIGPIQGTIGAMPDPNGREITARILDQGIETFGRAAWNGTGAALDGAAQWAFTAIAKEFGAVGWKSVENVFQGWADVHGAEAKQLLQRAGAPPDLVLQSQSKTVRRVAAAVDATASMIPYAVELGAAGAVGGPAGMYGVGLLLNLGNAYDSYGQRKDLSENEKLTGALGTAGSMSGVQMISPLGRAGDLFSSHTTKQAMDLVFRGANAGAFKVLWAGLTRGGIDAVSGQVALGLQRATMQLSSGKDPSEVTNEFWRGATQDPSMLGFHALGILGAFGNALTSSRHAYEMSTIVRALKESTPDTTGTRAEVMAGTAAQPDAHRTVFLPLDRFHEAADKIGGSARDLAAKVLGDAGASYDLAVNTKSEHLTIPADKLEGAIKAGLDEAIAQHGTFEPGRYSRNDLETLGQDMMTVFDGEYRKAAKLDPDKLNPGDAELYTLAKQITEHVGKANPEAIPHLIAEVRTIAKLRPDMTHAEIVSALYGENGIAPSGVVLPSEVKTPSPARLVEMAATLTGHGTEWKAFKDEQAQIKAKETQQKVLDAAHEELKAALVRNDRRYVDGERDKALSAAKQQAAEHPVLKTMRALDGDFSGLTKEQAAALTRPDGKPYRISADAIDTFLRPDEAAALKEKLGRAVSKTGKNAIDVHDLAEILGYKTTDTGMAGKHLLKDLVGTPDEKTFVKEQVEHNLDARFGPDLLTNPQALMRAAMDAMHTPAAAARLLSLYRQFTKDLDPAFKARSAFTAEDWKSTAERLLSLRHLEDVDPEVFAKLGGTKIKNAMEAAEKGDNRTAAQHAEGALLNHHLYLAARSLTDTIGVMRSRLTGWARSETPLRRLGFADPEPGPDGLNTYQRGREGLLSALGLMPSRDGADYSRAIHDVIDRAVELKHSGFLADGRQWNAEVLQNIVNKRSEWGALTPDEARQAYAFVRNVENMGDRLADMARKEREGQRSAADDLNDWLTNQGIREPVNPLAQDRNLQKREEFGHLNAAKKALMVIPRAFGWTNAPSNWTTNLLLSHLGPVGESFANGLRNAITARHELLMPIYNEWRQHHDYSMTKRPGYDPFKEIPGAAQMLSFDVGQADQRRVSASYLANLARWWGDADGRKRILQQFRTTPEAVEGALAKYLPKDVLDSIQKEKEVIEREWAPRLTAAELRRTGLPLRLSQPAEFTINGETYKGGHVTLSYDDRAGMGLDPRRALGDASLGSFNHDAVGFHRATMEGGFLEERSGGKTGARPDLGALTTPQTMADMAHHLAVGDWLLEATQTLLNPTTSGIMERYVAPGMVDAVQGMLMRVASEMRGGPSHIDPGARDSIAAWRDLKGSLSSSVIAGKLTIPIMHMTHPFIVGGALHGPVFAAKYTLPVFTEMMNSLPNWAATGRNEFIEQAQARSPYLRQRAGDVLGDIADQYFERTMQMSGASREMTLRVMEGIQDVGAKPLEVMDSTFSATIFEAERRWAIDQKMSPEEAIQHAEKIADRTMPSYAMHSRSGYNSTKGGFQSMIAAFMGYFATVRDLRRAKVFEMIDRDLRQKEAMSKTEAPPWYRLGSQMKWEAASMIPVVMGLSLSAYLGGKTRTEDGPDWERIEAGYHQRDWADVAAPIGKFAAEETVKRMTELQNVTSGMTERAFEYWGTKRSGNYDPGNLAFSPLEDAAKFGEAFFSPKDSGTKLAQHGGRLVGALSGMPMQPVLNVGGTALNWDEFHDALPTNHVAKAIDAADALIYGRKFGRSSKYQNRTPLSDLRDLIESSTQNDKGPAHKLTPW